VSLTLQVKDFDRLLPEADCSRVLETGTLTIGRGQENDWVLPDPERVISKQHCAIESAGGQYLLIDMSSNGVFFNRSETPIGQGNSVALKDGDHFRISHFEIEVRVSEHRDTAPGGHDDAMRAGSVTTFPELPGEPSVTDASLDDILGFSEDVGPAHKQEPEPGALPSQDFFAPAPADEGISADFTAEMEHVPLDQDFLQVPEPVPDAAAEIPDDWDEEQPLSEAPAQRAESGDISSWPDNDDPFGPTAAPGPDLAESEAPPPLPEQPAAAPLQAPRAPQPAAQPPAIAAKKTLEAFYAGAGLSEVEIPEAEVAHTLEMLGTLFREVVQGLMEVLAARSSIKSEFRLSQTIIQPVENNPLKFSLGVDDAMIALLTKHGKGYLPPVDAIQEALDDIKAHQVAVLAGMQVALTSLLARFDPNALEARIGQEKGIGTLLTAKKSRYWDEFTRLYRNIAVEAEDDFQRVFGREFGRAYEEQVRKQGKRRT